jgi:hypothetical protein
VNYLTVLSDFNKNWNRSILSIKQSNSKFHEPPFRDCHFIGKGPIDRKTRRETDAQVAMPVLFANLLWNTPCNRCNVLNNEFAVDLP